MVWDVAVQLYPQPADDLSLEEEDAKANIYKFPIGSSSQFNIQEASSIDYWQLTDNYGSPKP